MCYTVWLVAWHGDTLNSCNLFAPSQTIAIAEFEYHKANYNSITIVDQHGVIVFRAYKEYGITINKQQKGNKICEFYPQR